MRATSGRVIDDRLSFTPHALGRYVERYVDRDAVERLCRQGFGDSAILRQLSGRFAAQLAAFRTSMRARGERYLASSAVARIPFRLKLGRMRVVIAHGCCVTVLPDDRAMRRHPAEDRRAA